MADNMNHRRDSYLSRCFVISAAPSSCVMTEWGEWEPCSATCGLGMRRRERIMKMPSISGSMCKAEMAEVEKCLMPECRKLSQTNFMSDVVG